MNGARIKGALGQHWGAVAQSPHGPPSVASSELPPDYVLPVDLEVAKTKGLLACQLVRDGQRATLHSYWESDAARNAGWARFAHDARLALASTSDGVLADVRVPRVPLRKRVKPQAVLLGAVAVFGALSALRDYLGVLVEPAQLGVAFPQDEPLDVAESRPFEVPLRVLNRNRVAKLSVRGIDASLAPATKGSALTDSPLKVDLDSFPALTPGQLADIIVRGRAPRAAESVSVPDEYTVNTSFTLDAGLLRSSTHRLGPQRRVKVWPQAGWSPPEARGRCAQQCMFEGRLLIGLEQAGGLNVQVVLADASTHATLIGVEFAGTNCQSAIEHGEDVTKAACTTGPLRAFRSYDYHLIVASPGGRPLSPDEWRRLRPNVVVLR